MSDLAGAAARAVDQPQGDMIAILLEQHQRIRELFAHVKGASGEHKQQAFDELRALLAVHETAEEMVLRPVTNDAAGKAVADARNQEEPHANEVRKKLEKLHVPSSDFDALLADFEKSVDSHA